MTKYRSHYETLGEFITKAKGPGQHPQRKASEDEDGDWAGTKTIGEAYNLVEKGWPEGRALLMNAIAEASSTPTMLNAISMDVGGAYPIAAIAAAGDPLSMVNIEPIEDRVRPIVRLVVMRGGSAAYSAKEFTNYGAALLSYVEGLERLNFRVEITLCFCLNLDGGDTDNMSVTVKRAEEHVEFDRMAFVLAHPAFFRRIAFAVKERTPEVNEKLSWNYGIPRNPTAEEFDSNQILLPGVNMVKPKSNALKSPKACLEHLAPMIERQLKSAGMTPPPMAFAGESK